MDRWLTGEKTKNSVISILIARVHSINVHWKVVVSDRSGRLELDWSLTKISVPESLP